MNNKVLLIDSDTDLTLQLKKYLTSEGFDVEITSNSVEALDRARSDHYKLIILDIVTPRFDGFELLKSLKKADTCPIMVMTARDEHFDRIYALEVGADDYLLKPVNQRELLARMKVIMRRNASVSLQFQSHSLNINNIRLCPATREAYYEQNLLKLTGSEFEVLHFLMSNAGKVNSKEIIGKYVFGRTVSYYDRSIDMHISNIRKKIALYGKKPQIKTIRGAGYTFLSEQGFTDISAYANAL